MEIINQSEIFVKFLFKPTDSDKHSRTRGQLLEVFERLSANAEILREWMHDGSKTSPYYLMDYALVRRKIPVSYNKSGYFWTTSGVIFHISYMGRINCIEEAMVNLQAIVDNQVKEHHQHVASAVVYLSAPLEEYRLTP